MSRAKPVLQYSAPGPDPAGLDTTWLTGHLREVSVAVAYGLLLAALAVHRPDYYKLLFLVTWVDAAHLLILAVGMTLVILTRQIDISIGSQFSVCAVAAASLGAAGVPMPLVVLITLAIGAVMGAVNGLLVTAAGLPSIVVTLGTMVVLRGSLQWVSQGAAARQPRAFQWFGLEHGQGQTLIVLAAFAVFFAFVLALRGVAAGRAVYAVGSDQEAARLAGIRPKRVVLSVFILMGAMTALAALVNNARLPLVYPNVGTDKELKVIAAVVVGGTAISGGRGTLWGSLFGVALLSTIGPALLFFKVGAHWEKAIQGLIILAAVASDGLQRRRG